MCCFLMSYNDSIFCFPFSEGQGDTIGLCGKPLVNRRLVEFSGITRAFENAVHSL